MRKTILAVLVLAFASWCFPDVIPIPQTAKTLEGHWTGMPYDSRDLCRLFLTNNGGVFGRAFEGWPPTIYSINSYDVGSNGVISFKLAPVSNSYPVILRGQAAPNRILLSITSVGGGWSNACLLYREETVEKMLFELKSAMAPFEIPRKKLTE